MVAGNDDDDSGQGPGRWSKISTTTAEPRDLEVVQNFDDDDGGWSTSGWSTNGWSRPAAGRDQRLVATSGWSRPAAGHDQRLVDQPLALTRVGGWGFCNFGNGFL